MRGNSSSHCYPINTLCHSNVLRNIRFLTMTAEEFARVVSQTTLSDETVNGADQPNDNSVSFLNKNEQIAVFMNLAIPGIVPIQKCLSQETTPRCAPRKLTTRCGFTINLIEFFTAEHFTVRRYKPVTYATTTTLAQASSGPANANNKPVKSVCSKFQVVNSDLFIVGASIPIRLDHG